MKIGSPGNQSRMMTVRRGGCPVRKEIVYDNVMVIWILGDSRREEGKGIDHWKDWEIGNQHPKQAMDLYGERKFSGIRSDV